MRLVLLAAGLVLVAGTLTYDGPYDKLHRCGPLPYSDSVRAVWDDYVGGDASVSQVARLARIEGREEWANCIAR